MKTSESKMPAQIHKAFQTLWQEVQHLHFSWVVFRQLFCTSRERIELLNRKAGMAFGLFQRVLPHEILMSIARLLDPASQRKGRDENLSLEHLADIVNDDCKSLGAKLYNLRSAIGVKMKPFEDLRNKVYAHNDRAITPARYDGTSTVAGPTRADIEGALADIRTFMNEIELHYDNATSHYYSVDDEAPYKGVESGDAETLIQCLEKLERFENIERSNVGVPPRPRPQ